MKRSVILAALVSVMCVIPLRAGDYGAVKDEQAFRRELMVKTSAVTSIQASFVQEKFLSVFSSTVKSEGKFYWEKEDKICLDYRTPAKYRITIAGDKIKTVTNGKATVLSAKGNPMMDQMSALITSCMTGNLNAMGAGFKTSVQESAADYRITITPQSPDGSDDGISLTESSRAQDECRYDFSLKLRRKELSGIMVARTVSPGTVRVVGATYFGMTLFDMTLTKDSYTMNSVAEPLSGKAFASFLAMKLRKTMNL